MICLDQGFSWGNQVQIWINFVFNQSLGISPGWCSPANIIIPSDLITAAISVSGPLEVPCSPPSPLPMMHWHGSLDPVFPWLGGLYHSVPYTVGAWRGANMCGEEEEQEWLGLGVLRSTWQCQEATQVLGVVRCGHLLQVVQVAIEGGGHSWPPARVLPEEVMWGWAVKWMNTVR